MILLSTAMWLYFTAPCMQPKKVGHCKAAIRRWYYNKKAGECLKFIYGGCQGNDNNFKTQEECEKKCGKKIGNTLIDYPDAFGLHVLDNDRDISLITDSSCTLDLRIHEYRELVICERFMMRKIWSYKWWNMEKIRRFGLQIFQGRRFGLGNFVVVNALECTLFTHSCDQSQSSISYWWHRDKR